MYIVHMYVCIIESYAVTDVSKNPKSKVQILIIKIKKNCTHVNINI